MPTTKWRKTKCRKGLNAVSLCSSASLFLSGRQKTARSGLVYLSVYQSYVHSTRLVPVNHRSRTEATRMFNLKKSHSAPSSLIRKESSALKNLPCYRQKVKKLDVLVTVASALSNLLSNSSRFSECRPGQTHVRLLVETCKSEKESKEQSCIQCKAQLQLT